MCDLFAGITTTYETAYTNENPPVIAFDGPELPPGKVNTPYMYQFTVSGGWPPYSWDFGGTDPPKWLALTDTGLLTGTPTVAGTYRFKVQVTDYSGPSFSFLTYDRQLVITA